MVPRFTIFLLAFLLIACSNKKERIAAGMHALENGHYSRALEIFQKEYNSDPHDPELLAGLGSVLSLKRASVIASTEMLEASLRIKKNNGVRRSLFLLYLDLGLEDRAALLISPDRLGTNEFFSPEVSLLRLTLGCLESPSQKKLKELMAQPPGPFRDYLAVRCMVEDRFKSIKADDVILHIDSIRDEQTQCEALHLLPERLVSDPFRQSVRIRECSARFAGSLLLHRDPMKVKSVTAPRKLFESDQFIPPDPLEEPSEHPVAPEPENRDAPVADQPK